MAESLFTELKRRNVFKVGVAYLILAWVVIQIADVIDIIGVDSELKEIWVDSSHSVEWFDYLKNLQNRILDNQLN